MSEFTTALDVLNQQQGNITRAAAILGMSPATVRKHRDNGTLDTMLIVDNKLYVYKHDVKVIVFDEWERMPQSKVPLIHEGNRDKYKTTTELGRVVYWRKVNV